MLLLIKTKAAILTLLQEGSFGLLHDWKAKVENHETTRKEHSGSDVTLRLLHSCPRSHTVCVADGVKIASGSGKADRVLEDQALHREHMLHTRDLRNWCRHALTAQTCSSCCFVSHLPWHDGAAGCFSVRQSHCMSLSLPCQTPRWNLRFSKFTLHSGRPPIAGLSVAQRNIGNPFIVTLI